MSCNISLSSPCRNLTSVERQSLRLEEGSTGACLFAVARLQQFGDGVGPQLNMQANENEFVSRVGVDGRFTYVDPRYVCLAYSGTSLLWTPFGTAKNVLIKGGVLISGVALWT